MDALWDIIVVSYNSAKVLDEFWTAPPEPVAARVILVDNASTDGSVQKGKGFADHVLSLTSNVGLSRANNIGAKSGNAPYILFANPDVRVSWEDLPILQHHLETTGGIVAPRLQTEEGRAQANGRGEPRLISQISHRLGVGATRSNAYLSPDTVAGGTGVSWVLGAALAMKRRFYEEVGGWDERFFLYYEDVDLCLRARQLGGEIAILENVHWQHAWARQSRTWKSKAALLHASSAVKFFLKYPRYLW